MLLFLNAILLEGFFMKPGEIILILCVVLIFFGGKKIPELMRGLGQGIKEFKDASKGETKDSSTKEGDDTKGQIK